MNTLEIASIMASKDYKNEVFLIDNKPLHEYLQEADTEKTENTVLWKRIGRVNHSVEDRKEQKEHGIVFVDTYSDEDWIKYRDAAFLEVDSYEWREWISSNWSEELYRRHINYTYPCYQRDENIDWLFSCNWCFDRAEYEKLIASCRPHWWIY